MPLTPLQSATTGSSIFTIGTPGPTLPIRHEISPARKALLPPLRNYAPPRGADIEEGVKSDECVPGGPRAVGLFRR